MNTFTVLEPSYLAKFKCDGKACDSLCCRNWQQVLDDETIEKYRRLDGGTGKIMNGITYDEKIGGSVLKHKCERCYFLRSDLLCQLVIDYGESALSDVCHEFPRKTQIFPNSFAERTLCLSCPVAARLALTEPISFAERELKLDRDNYYGHIDDADTLNGVSFFFLQKKSIEILQNKEHSLKERIACLGIFLKRADELLRNGQNIGHGLRDFSWVSNYEPYITDFRFISNLLPNVSRAIDDSEPDTQRYLELINKNSSLSYDEFINAWQSIEEEFSQEIENFLVNEFFSALYPFHIEGDFTRNFIFFRTVYEFLLLLIILEENRTQDVVINAVIYISRRTNHFAYFSAALKDYIENFQ